MTQTPNHIAIIMDGNGRWAKKRGLPRTLGHQQGVEATKRTIRAAGDLGVPYLTLFGFSTENWKRPAEEVNELMRLLRMYLRSETAELHKNNVRLRVIGDRKALAPDIVELIENAETLMAENTGLALTIALNYGGRDDILQAAMKTTIDLMESAAMGDMPKSALQASHIFETHLMTNGMPDPDLLIRTSGEQRISNFLLWQCAYSEIVFTKTLWPDFAKQDLEEAIEEYAARDRRYGALKDDAKDEDENPAQQKQDA